MSLMKDQVAGLKSGGIAAAIISPESTATEMKDIRLGQFDLLFGSPEALLNSHRTIIQDLKESIKAVFVNKSHCMAKW